MRICLRIYGLFFENMLRVVDASRLYIAAIGLGLPVTVILCGRAYIDEHTQQAR